MNRLLRQAWALKPFFYILVVVVALAWALSRKPPTPTASTGTASAAPDFEHDLEGRCKDWLFYRNKTYRLGREGDAQGAAKARAIMNRYNDDLRKHFSETEISSTIIRLESQ